MPKIDDLFKTSTVLGVAIGVGATVLAATLVPSIPVLVRSARPTARAAIKSGLVLVERGREILAEAGEELEDLLAEVRSELQQEQNVKGEDIDGDKVFDEVLAEAREELKIKTAIIDDAMPAARTEPS